MSAPDTAEGAAQEGDLSESRPAPAELLTRPYLLRQELDEFPVSEVEAIEAAVADAAENDRLGPLAGMVDEALKIVKKALTARLAAGLIQERMNQKPAAATTFLLLARSLLSSNFIEAARWVARRGLANREDHRFVELLLKIGAKLNEDVLAEDVAYCRERCPEAPELRWWECQRADAAGNKAKGDRLAIKAFVGFMAIDAADSAEDPLLRVLETEQRGVLLSLVETFPTMAAGGKGDLLEVTLDLSLPRLREAGLHRELSDAFKAILDSGHGNPDIRKLYVECLTDAMGGAAAVGGLIEASRLPDPSVPIAEALKRMDALTKVLSGSMLPGTHVLNRDWGIGKVTAHDGTFLTVDFKDKPGHRIALEIAERALVIVPDTLVTVAYFDDPDGIERELAEDPVAVVVRALVERGGEATYKEIKEVLFDRVVPAKGWAAWWKKARDRFDADPRVDHTQAFRDTVRLREADDEDEEPQNGSLLPVYNPRWSLKKAARTILKLLEQHPEAQEEARRIYADRLAMALPEERAKDGRLAALPLLEKWLPERHRDWVAVADECVEAGVGVTSLTEDECQAAVLGLALEGEQWELAACGALSSRCPAVRETAWRALLDRAGTELRAALGTLMASKLAPASAVLIVQEILGKWEDLNGRQPDPWSLLVTIGPALTRSAPAKAMSDALKLIAPGSTLAQLLQDTPIPEGSAYQKLGLTLRALGEGEGADAVEALLTQAGWTALVELLPGREPPMEDEADLPPERNERVTLMTRGTYDLLQQRMRAMRAEMETVLKELKAARELGDLSENADYDAARGQQGMLKAAMDSTQRALAAALFIEDLERVDGVATPGTEVTYRNGATGEERAIWLLGEGDSHWSESVVSYRAPVGQALLGKRVGETADLVMGETTTPLEIVRVTEKLPGPLPQAPAEP